MIHFTLVETAWGWFGFVARDGRLVATWLPRSESVVRRTMAEHWPDATEAPQALPRFRRRVVNYFAGQPQRFEVDIDLSNLPPFREAVLRACRLVPYGKTASYADLARQAGNPAARRAAGGAMANNPVPLVIPCHRIVRSDGTLGGFSSPSGVREKKRLLALEGIDLPGDRDRRVRTVHRPLPLRRKLVRRAG